MPGDRAGEVVVIARPRLVLAGLSGGSGKTLVSLGLTRALADQGLRVTPCKKGPDYIDAAWLTLAARRPAVNLDAFLFPETHILPLFWEKTAEADLAVIEGNRGLFDGLDAQGSYSTAALARTLCAPVVLCLDVTKMTRTAAAVVAGVAHFEPGLALAGVILNRTGGARHRALVRECVESLAGVPVLGALPRLPQNPIPERHMGLFSDREYSGAADVCGGLAAVVRDNVDLDRVLAIARSAPPLAAPAVPPVEAPAPEGDAPVIGVVRDAALWFYYPENFEALTRAGARLAFVSLLDAAPWPALDGLYLGGGFPETQAARLADNFALRERVRALAVAGLPVYAECGGFMYLCEALVTGETTYPMAGVFPLTTTLCPRPQGLGYSLARVVAPNPFHPVGAFLPGHEFHYSRCLGPNLPSPQQFCLSMERGAGMIDGRDGLVSGNVFAAYTHIHAAGVPHWAGNFVAAARRYRAALGKG